MERNCFLKCRDCGAIGGGKEKKRKEEEAELRR